MEYTLYRLKFSTGLHIGTDDGGPSLDDGRKTIHSDTLFSALCCESAKTGEISQLYDGFAGNKLAISDALPFFDDEFYLPKPILFAKSQKHEGDSALKKRFKAIEFIPVSLFDDYLMGLKGNDLDPDVIDKRFGHMVVDTKVSIKGLSQPMPYSVAYWHFEENSGLYIIAGYDDSKLLELFEKTLTNLGLSGIGGKLSAGLGKFQVEKSPVPQRLASMLADTGAEYQMLLGIALPCDNELDYALSGGWYSTVRRGGYVRSDTYSQSYVKKRTMYALAPGSCVRSRFDGTMPDLSDGGAHPVWRCCKTLFAGVRL